MSDVALRPYLADDAAALADLFCASIETLAAEDYDDDQRAAWAGAAADEAAFGARLAGWLTLVATIDGEIAGFASLKGADRVEMLYVAPEAAGEGVGAALCGALEALAQVRGATRLMVDASDAARGFFDKRGYVAQARNSVMVGDEWLANTSMMKPLAANS